MATPYAVQKFHVVLNLAVGGNWGGKYGIDDTAFPLEMEVAYVRVYQVPQQSPARATGPPAGDRV